MTDLLRLLSAACLAGALIAAPSVASAPASSSSQEDSGARGRILTAADSYVRMQAVRAAIQADFRVRGMLHVDMSLDAPSSSTRRLIRERELWLRDAYSQAMLLYAGRMYRWGDVPDADMIAQLLQAETNRLLGEGEATIVLDTVMIHVG